MLLQFDSTLKDFDNTCLKQGRALENLLGAFQANQHVIFVEMEDLRVLQQRAVGILSASSKIALKTLMNRAVEYQALLNIISYKIIIYLESDNPQGIVREGNTWYVPLQYFGSAGLLQSTILGENDADAELLIHFAKIYQYDKQLNAFLLAGRPKSGGGSGTPKVLTSYLRHEYSPCLCVTDSDKLHPKYKQSSTSRNCTRAAQIRSRIVEHISLEEREIENLIPVDLLKKVADAGDFLRDFETHVLDGEEFWRYIDLKNGLSLKWILKKDTVTQNYWKKAGLSLQRRQRNCDFCKLAPGIEDPENPCRCTNLPGLGDGLLGKVITHLDENQPKFTSRLCKGDLRWKTLGQVVFDFAIAPKGEMLLAG